MVAITMRPPPSIFILEIIMSDTISLKQLLKLSSPYSKQMGDEGFVIRLSETETIEISNDLTTIHVPHKGAVILLSSVTDITKRALGPNPYVGNTGSLSVLYLAALAVKHPGLSKEQILNPATGLQAKINYLETTTVTVRSIDPAHVRWHLPEGGIQHFNAMADERIIPMLPRYGIDSTGKVYDYEQSKYIVPYNDDRLYYLETDKGNITVDKVTLIATAFGKYGNPVEDNIYFIDGDETNIVASNITMTVNSLDTFAVELAEGDEDNIL